MTRKDQNLIWEQYNDSQVLYFYPKQLEVTFEVKVNLTGRGSPFSQEQGGEIYVRGTDIQGYFRSAPIGLTIPKTVSYFDSQTPEFVKLCLPYLEKLAPRKTERAPEFQKQEAARMDDYNSGGTYKGD